MLSSLFKAPEIHPEAKTMKEYYLALRAAVNEVRTRYENADDDAAFKKAADIIEEVVELCLELETVTALQALDINTERSKLLKQLGTEGMIDVIDKPSRLLAIRYRELMLALLNKEYWPSADCKSFARQSVLTVYAAKHEERREETIKRINAYAHRIREYDNKLAPQPKI